MNKKGKTYRIYFYEDASLKKISHSTNFKTIEDAYVFFEKFKNNMDRFVKQPFSRQFMIIEFSYLDPSKVIEIITVTKTKNDLEENTIHCTSVKL